MMRKKKKHGQWPRRVRLGLLLTEIGQSNNIQVSEEDIKRTVIEQSGRFPGQEQEVIQYYQNNPDAIQQLAGPMFEELVMDYILEMAKVTNNCRRALRGTGRKGAGKGSKKAKSAPKKASSKQSKTKKASAKEVAPKKAAPKKKTAAKKNGDDSFLGYFISQKDAKSKNWWPWGWQFLCSRLNLTTEC